MGLPSPRQEMLAGRKSDKRGRNQGPRNLNKSAFFRLEVGGMSLWLSRSAVESNCNCSLPGTFLWMHSLSHDASDTRDIILKDLMMDRKPSSPCYPEDAAIFPNL